MKYNLVRNGNLYSITSGAGNKTLDWGDLYKLQDNYTTVFGVNLDSSDCLHLELDLCDRIKLDGIYLYMSATVVSGTVLDNLNFYYKNDINDDYSLAGKGTGSSYYYATVPGYSAPRILLVTISGVVGELYEFQVFNDDYLVAFGESGIKTTEYLDSTPIGEEGSPSEIKIYNNANVGTYPVDAYVTIDYSGTPADDYIKIGLSEDGIYYGYNDGILVEDNYPNSTYRWDMGIYDGTEFVIGTGLQLEDLSSSENFLLGDLPCDDDSNCECGLNTGSNGWDFDRENNRMFVMFSDYFLKLYEYDYRNDEWDFIGKVDPVNDPHTSRHSIDSHIQFATMGYLDNKIYVCVDRSGKFGYYDLDGPINNWTTLSGIPIPALSVDSSPPITWSEEVSIVSDQQEYIYAITFTIGDDDIPATHSYFGRYSTISGSVVGWESLNNNYFNNGNEGSLSYAEYARQHLSYDYDRNCIYLTNGQGNTTVEYIQKYDVLSDSWYTNYIDLKYYLDLISVSIRRDNLLACYWDNYIYIIGANFRYLDGIYYYFFLRYNILEDKMHTVLMGDFHINNTYDTIYMLPMKQPYNMTDFGATVYFARGYYYVASPYDLHTNNLFVYNGKEYTGTYTSPVFKLDDKYMASYFALDTVTVSGCTNVSYSVESFDGTARIRSSDTKPLSKNEIFWIDTTNFYIDKISVYTSDVVDNWCNEVIRVTYEDVILVTISKKTSYIAVLTGGVDVDHSYVGYKLQLIDNDGSRVGYVSDDEGYYNFDKIEFDSDGGIWCYGGSINAGYRFYHFSSNLEIEYEGSSGFNSVIDFSVEFNGAGVWYIDNALLEHMDEDGDELHNSIALNDPMFLCRTNDNGVWVFDYNETTYAKRYDEDGELVKSFTLGNSIDEVSPDDNNGFWYRRGNYIYHVNSDGSQSLKIHISGTSCICAGNDGCIVWSEDNDEINYVDNELKVITRTFNMSSSGPPVFISHDYDDDIEYCSDLIPISYDPVWGDSGSLEWREVSHSGHYLWKHLYHQIELTLRTYNVDYSPVVKSIGMAPALKLVDVYPKNSKSMYVKTDIPYGAVIDDYETKLRTWWSVLV